MNITFKGIDEEAALYVIKALTQQKDGLLDEIEPLRGEVPALRKEVAFLRRQVRHLRSILKQAETAGDEWEIKNGDAPHRVVCLQDRIMVNAGLPGSAAAVTTTGEV